MYKNIKAFEYKFFGGKNRDEVQVIFGNIQSKFSSKPLLRKNIAFSLNALIRESKMFKK